MVKTGSQWLVLALYLAFVKKGIGSEIKSLQEENHVDSVQSTTDENENDLISNFIFPKDPYEFINNERYKRTAGAKKMKEKFDSTREQAKSGAEISKSKAENPEEEMKGMAEAAKEKAEEGPSGAATSAKEKAEEMKEASKGAMSSNPFSQRRKKRTPGAESKTENGVSIEDASSSAESAMQMVKEMIKAGEEMSKKLKELYEEAKKKIEEIAKSKKKFD